MFFLQHYLAIYYPVDYTLDKLQEVIDPEKFFRINRKMIVSFDAIKNMIPLFPLKNKNRIKST